jgi:hypothetical protein
MITIIDISSRKSLFLLYNISELVQQGSDTLFRGRTYSANDMTSVEIIEDVTPPADWEPIKYTLSEGVWTQVENFVSKFPSFELYQEHVNELSAYDSQAYARQRKVKYDLLNQDAMRYDDIKNSTTTWIDAIDAIKQEYPK